MRQMHCDTCGQVRDFGQTETRKITGEPQFRRRWFECPVCGRTERFREVRDGVEKAGDRTKCDLSHIAEENAEGGTQGASPLPEPSEN